MKVALHTLRDRSEPGRLLGGTYVWGADLARGERFELYEELPHTITITRRRGGLEREIKNALGRLRDRTVTWADKGQKKAGTRNPDRASRFGRFLRDPDSRFSYVATEVEDGVRYDLIVPNLNENQLRSALELPRELRSAERTSRDAIPPYSVLREANGMSEDLWRRTHVVERQLRADEIIGLPSIVFDLEVMNWQPAEPEATTREGLLKTLEAHVHEGMFSPELYAWMDDGLLRKHVRHILNKERDERIYDAVVRAPDGRYFSFTTLPVTEPRITTDFGQAEIIACADQDGIADRLKDVFREQMPIITSGHNHIAYDIRQLKQLGTGMDVGADGTEAKTRFALAGSTIEQRTLPDGRIENEDHHAFLADHRWRGIDNLDPAAWIRYVDELSNAKLASVTRALTGRNVRKILDHEELEAIVQAQAHLERANTLLAEVGLDGASVSELLERERAYALSDVWFSHLNHERLAPIISELALTFDATLSEICTTSPEAHARRQWDSAGRGDRADEPIKNERYARFKDKLGFTAEGAFATFLRADQKPGRHEVLLARRTSGRYAADAINHPTLERLAELSDAHVGFERGWIERYVDAMLTEPLYALVIAGTSAQRRDALAWKLGLTGSDLDRLKTRLASVPEMSGAIAASRKHLFLPATDEGYAQAASLHDAGLIEPLEDGIALVYDGGVIYDGSRRMKSGVSDPGSSRGYRNAFTKRVLPPLIDELLEGDLEGALDSTRDAYAAFVEGDTTIAKRLGKDARDYSILACGGIFEEARRMDARKGDPVALTPTLRDARARLFGFDDAPDAGLFGDVYAPAKHRGLLAAPVLAAFGAGPRIDRPQWNAFADYVASGRARGRDAFLGRSDL